jgi:hypothetical protein
MDKERMVEPSMNEMIAAFRKAHLALEQTMNVAKGIAEQMKQGALVGQAGDQFVQGINDVLIPQVKKLEEKLEEMEVDVQRAVARIKLAEAEAKKHFGEQ